MMRQRTWLGTVAVALVASLVWGSAALARAGADEATGSADEVLKRAYEARANWGPGFPGFSADITVKLDGQTENGSLRVSPEGRVELTMPDGAARQWASAQIRSLVMHRGIDGPPRLPSGAEFAEPATETGAEHPLGRLIRLPDDRMHSTYRVKDDEIREVSRTMGNTRFAIRILANHCNEDGKRLPQAYTVTYWDAETGDLQRVETFHETWKRVGHLDLPESLTLITSGGDDDIPAVRQITFSNLKLGAEGDSASE